MLTATKFEYEGYDVTKELYKDDGGIKTHFTKGIVLDSIQFKPGENIQSFIIEQMHKGIKHGHFYNFFIDKTGKIYYILNYNTSGNVCTFDVYSLEASKTFGEYCPVTDAKFSPRTKFPDQILKSILVEFENGYMTEKTKQSLRKLCILILRRTNLEFTANAKIERVTNQNIYLRRMFPGTEAELEYSEIGDIFKDTIDFMIFKKSLYNDLMAPMDSEDDAELVIDKTIEKLEIR